jgi:predicted dienelactone hydrolase
MTRLICAIVAVLIATSPAASAANAPSVPGVDAPELARPGTMGVGFRTITLTNPRQPDLAHPDPKTGKISLRDRRLVVDIWYPAAIAKDAPRVIYRGTLWGEPPLAPVAFTQAGMAVAGAMPRGRAHPLVIVSHGYSNNPAVMTWLTENLASKGYVVAAIHHRDPNPYVASVAIRASPNHDRPHDIAFVTARLRVTLGRQIDPARVALIGYSQGGYGVLTAGGATLDPRHPTMQLIADGWLNKVARGMPGAGEIVVPGVSAIVALAPGGGGESNIWGPDGLTGIKAPLLLIAGDADLVVGYTLGAKSFFEQAVNSDRYLLTYKQAGHSIALNPAPAEMRGSLWDMDWFEDPIWRQDRINGINLHFITAFLALALRGEEDMRAYLDVQSEDSDTGGWKVADSTPWGAFSPGGPGVTLWKGFQRRHARGMTLHHLRADSAISY